MAFQIVRNDIVKVEADAIVNTANPQVTVGPGVDEAIYSAAGWEELLEERRKIGPMEPGEVVHTPAFALRAKYIIHVIGPAWQGGDCGERETVAQCYRTSLELAAELGCESIAFPLMATGTYGFPKDEALRIATAEISAFLLSHEMEVFLVVYDKESYTLSGKLFKDIASYMDESECREAEGKVLLQEAQASRARTVLEDLVLSRRIESAAGGFFGDAANEDEDLAPLEDRLKHLDKTFQEHLFMLIDRRGLKDPEVYKKANIDRKHFSKIRSNVAYNPSKRTALALAIALELNLDETEDLLLRAGLAFSPSSKFDRIVEYCIDHKVYDIMEINTILFAYDQPLLGA